MQAMTAPQPSPKFWDKIADKYAKSPVRDEAAYQKKLAMTRRHLRGDMRVLEFGCGTGTTALAHAPYVHSVLATDLSGRMLEIARDRAQEAGATNVTFRQSALDDFDADGQQFDVILGLSLLHLLHDRDTGIARIYELLKPGGLFVSSTVCLADWMWAFKIIGPIGHWLGFFPTVRAFRAAELEKSMTGAGFAIEERFQPDRKSALFLIARKPGGPAES